MQLENAVGGSSYAGTKLKSTIGWYDRSTNYKPATNESGFSALPGGRRSSDGRFNSVGYLGIWWKATQIDASDARHWSMHYTSEGVSWYYGYKTSGYSVRCVKD